MEFFDPHPETLRLAADFIQRRKPVIDVKNRVLEPLGHDRAGDLLKLQDEMHVLGAGRVVQIFRETEKQNIAQEN